MIFSEIRLCLPIGKLSWATHASIRQTSQCVHLSEIWFLGPFLDSRTKTFIIQRVRERVQEHLFSFFFFFAVFIDLYLFLYTPPILLSLLLPSPMIPTLPIYSVVLVFFYFAYRLVPCMSLLGYSLLSRFSGTVNCRLFFCFVFVFAFLIYFKKSLMSKYHTHSI